jgi:protein-tyrosine-phosphatase
VDILVVCTANQCRSPLTAASLRAHAMKRSLPVVVTSAGVQAIAGLPATPPTMDAARRVGLDLADHRSLPLAADDVNRADLVLGLERRHVQEVVLHDREAFTKTFTLKELARRGADVGHRQPEETVSEWLVRVHDGRRPMDLLGMSPDDDLTDPSGSNAVDHHTTAEEIDRLAAQVLDLLFPTRDSTPTQE